MKHKVIGQIAKTDKKQTLQGKIKYAISTGHFVVERRILKKSLS